MNGVLECLDPVGRERVISKPTGVGKLHHLKGSVVDAIVYPQLCVCA